MKNTLLVVAIILILTALSGLYIFSSPKLENRLDAAAVKVKVSTTPVVVEPDSKSPAKQKKTNYGGIEYDFTSLNKIKATK
ncbi:MAG: hypothetical protein PHF79_01820 [Candidatus Pacebacteria bacterium]|nr:hypothetical protein [Candidatus Paceibacterota bacterium]